MLQDRKLSLPATMLATLAELYATAAPSEPNPNNLPLSFDLPATDRVSQPVIIARLAANAPLPFVDQYIANLKQSRAIAMGVGDQDGLRFDAKKLHEVLNRYGISDPFTTYPGVLISAVAERFQNLVMPIFRKNLCLTVPCY